LIRLFVGHDAREAVGAHAFIESVLDHCSMPVSITHIGSKETERDGTNAFTYSRFMIPSLCHFQGFALWMDGADMLCRGDLAELWEMRESWFAAKVVKHEYIPASDRKYIGTDMESPNLYYPRKNWSSVVLFDCGHYLNRCLTPEYIAGKDGSYLHRFGWIPDERIGGLPMEWNWLDEYGENEGAKLVHWTNGIPGFYHYRHAPHAEEWKAAVRKVTRGMA
jgi:hypothetical protein